MIIAFNQKTAETPFKHLRIPVPTAPKMTLIPDNEIIQKIKGIDSHCRL